MGCAASRQKYDSAIIAEAKPTPQNPLPGSAVLAQPNTFQVRRQLRGDRSIQAEHLLWHENIAPPARTPGTCCSLHCVLTPLLSGSPSS